MIAVNGKRPCAMFESWQELKEDIYAEGAHERYFSGDEVEIELKDGSKHVLQFTWDAKDRPFFLWKCPAFESKFGKNARYDTSVIVKEIAKLEKLLPDDLREVIEPYTAKQLFDGEWNETTGLLFLPSGRQFFGWDEGEDPEEAAFELCKTGVGRIRVGDDGYGTWSWLRSAYGNGDVYYVIPNGGSSNGGANTSTAVCPSFSI